jgi:hypothetical protein
MLGTYPGYPVKWGDVAVHREDSVRYDEYAAVARLMFFCVLKYSTEVLDITVLIDGSVGLAQPHAIYDAAMVQLVTYDKIPFAN